MMMISYRPVLTSCQYLIRSFIHSFIVLLFNAICYLFCLADCFCIVTVFWCSWCLHSV